MRVAFAITFILSCLLTPSYLPAREEFPPLSAARIKGFWLTVSKDGTCTGTVTSDVAGINCGSGDDCKRRIREDTIAHLTATPDGGCSFGGWSGDGTGTTTRTVVISQDRAVTATFTSSGTIIYAWAADSTTWQTPNGTGTTESDPAGSSVDFDTGTKTEGSASLKYTIPGDAQGTMGSDPPSDQTVTAHNGEWLYFRWWMKFDSSYDWGNSTQTWKAGRGNFSDAHASPPWTLWIQNTSIGVNECAGCSPSTLELSYDFDPSSNTDVQNWQEYVFGMKRQTAAGNSDGEIHLWVNCTEVDSITDITFTTSNVSWRISETPGDWIYPQLNDASAGGIVWTDDVETSTGFNAETC